MLSLKLLILIIIIYTFGFYWYVLHTNVTDLAIRLFSVFKKYQEKIVPVNILILLENPQKMEDDMESYQHKSASLQGWTLLITVFMVLSYAYCTLIKYFECK